MAGRKICKCDPTLRVDDNRPVGDTCTICGGSIEPLDRFKLPCTYYFEFEALPEDEGPEGHFGYDTEEENEAAVKAIRDQLDSGNDAAWFIAKVTCKGPYGFKGTDYLGGCSYNSFEEFKKDAYYEDMCAAAYRYMIEDMREAVNRGQIAKQVLDKYLSEE